MRWRGALLAAALAAVPAAALENAQWPPPGEIGARMRELQETIMSRDSAPAQREAAREELSGLLKSPAGQARGRTPDEKPTRPARAAVTDPVHTPLVPVAPASPVPVPAEGVAKLEVVVPPKPIVNPHTGSVVVPAGPGPTFAIDPRTGAVLHGNATGYVDPRTGQFTPR